MSYTLLISTFTATQITAQRTPAYLQREYCLLSVTVECQQINTPFSQISVAPWNQTDVIRKICLQQRYEKKSYLNQRFFPSLKRDVITILFIISLFIN